MTEERKAKLVQIDGSQAVRLPADFRFRGYEVYISRDARTGDVILSSRPRRNTGKEFIAFLDSLNIQKEERDKYMPERPMTHPVG